MSFQDENQCVIFLVGYLSTMPTVSADSNEYHVKISRYRYCNKQYKNTIETYTVIIAKEQLKLIKDFGFPGALVSVQGDLRIKKDAEITAQKIDFLDKSSKNKQEASFIFNLENDVEKIPLEKNRLFYLAKQTGWVH